MSINAIRFIKKQIRTYKYKRIAPDFILKNDDPIQKKGVLIEKEVFCGGLIEHFSMIGRLTSYKKPYSSKDNYSGNGWIGRSHDSNKSGTVFHSLTWLKAECEKHSLSIKELPFDYHEQIWLYISKN